MGELGKSLLVIGAGLMVVGLVVLALGKIPGMGKLPGDIVIKRENFTLYFPLATCLLISLVMSLIFYLWSRR